MVYLDNAATTRVCPEAAEAAVHMMTECFGNPSTTYKLCLLYTSPSPRDS